MLIYLQQVSHSTVISIQCGRPGLFMKPGAHRIYKRVTEYLFGFSLWSKDFLGIKTAETRGKGRNLGMGLTAELQTLRKGSGTGGGTLVAERARESWQAVAVSGHVVTGAIAVHALGTGLAAVVSIKPRGAN